MIFVEFLFEPLIIHPLVYDCSPGVVTSHLSHVLTLRMYDTNSDPMQPLQHTYIVVLILLQRAEKTSGHADTFDGHILFNCRYKQPAARVLSYLAERGWNCLLFWHDGSL